MADSTVDKFGRFVIANARDRGIEFFEGAARARWKAPALQALQAKLQGLSPAQIDVIRECVVRSIDHVLHDFLFALVEAHNLKQGIEVLVDGENVVDASDGLHGELYSNDGWIAKYSAYPEPE